ncbi:plasmid pRiA4b ORF-3 family protein [Mesorhizobium calcicola]|uniref:Plasmid pRiA4b ORF-3 family protein n=1 Tax=Mesorhizobium calcicola TaxID=1300310 RepID=A0ABW4W9H2_9HYPH
MGTKRRFEHCPGLSFIYLYDFCDHWEHLVTIKKFLTLDAIPKTAACIDGARARPPEDVGGISGFENFLAIMADRDDPEYRDVRRWCGGHFDPEWFDLTVVDKDVRSALKPNVRRRLHQPKPKRGAGARGKLRSTTEGSQLGFGRGRSYTDLSGSRQPIRHQQRRRYGRILARGAARLMGSEALLQGGAETAMAGQNASWTAVRPPRIRPLPATPCQSARDYASYRATRSTTPRSPSFTNSTLACRLAANREKAIVSVRFGS